MTQHLGASFPAFLLPIVRLSLWLAILVAIFVPLERLFAVSPQKFLRRGLGTDLAYYFINGLLISFLLSVPVAILAWTVHRLVPGGVLAMTVSLPLGVRLLAALVLSEIGYYWAHRLSHAIPFLWRFHAIHHSAEHVDFLVNSRAHPIDMVFGRFCALVPMYVLGLAGPIGPSGTLVPIVVTLYGALWGFFVHANLRLRFGPLEWLVTTPAFHHWHHTRTGPIDRNFSSNLPWLDWIFGTAYLPRDAWPESYGISSKMPDDLIDQLAYPLLPPPPEPVFLETEAANALDVALTQSS
jgi:sterol desaturase/sphingolipid hydroxylase (fatty acid hydroxylase superfamily)